MNGSIKLTDGISHTSLLTAFDFDVSPEERQQILTSLHFLKLNRGIAGSDRTKRLRKKKR